MIQVTRLDGTTTLVNPDLIETAESNPDTLITLANGRKLIVRESLDSLLKKFIAYQQLIHKPLLNKVIQPPAPEYPDDAP